MNKQIAGIVTLTALLAMPAMAQKVHVDYDRSVDFDAYETFLWKAPKEASLADQSPLMDSRIKNAIEYQLTTAGLREDNQSPDLYVTYHTDSKQEVRFNTTHMGYGYGGGWGWDPYWGHGGRGMGSSTTTAHTYERGTLIVDIWDAKTNNAVFRGTAEAVAKGNPEKAAKQIDRAIQKIAKRFQSMHARGK